MACIHVMEVAYAFWQPDKASAQTASCSHWPVMAYLMFALPTAQVVADLKTLRELAEHLLHFDAVTFLSYLETLRAGEGISSFWLFHDAAHLIFDEV